MQALKEKVESPDFFTLNKNTIYSLFNENFFQLSLDQIDKNPDLIARFIIASPKEALANIVNIPDSTLLRILYETLSLYKKDLMNSTKDYNDNKTLQLINSITYLLDKIQLPEKLKFQFLEDDF